MTVIGILMFQASLACPNGASALGVAVNDTRTASASIWIWRTCSGSIGGKGNTPVVPIEPVVPGLLGFAMRAFHHGNTNATYDQLNAWSLSKGCHRPTRP